MKTGIELIAEERQRQIDFENELGKSLKELRKNKNLTLRYVEEQTGISNSYLSQLENGKIANPSIFVIYKLSTIYGVSLDDLMYRKKIKVMDKVEKIKEKAEELRQSWYGVNNYFAAGQKMALTKILSFIDSLEVKEVGLDSNTLEDNVVIKTDWEGDWVLKKSNRAQKGE